LNLVKDQNFISNSEQWS